MLRATTPYTFSTSQRPKVLRDRQFLTLFTSKCALSHNAVHFFVISTSKTAPNPSVFNTFYFQMCFAPQRHALFQHLNFQKWSGAEVFCTCWLGNVLQATTACNFSSLISPDVSAPAALASLLFGPPEPQNHEKTQCFATFLPFRAPPSSFFWSFLFWLFSLLTAFSSLHIVGSLTSKLPSVTSCLFCWWHFHFCQVRRDCWFWVIKLLVTSTLCWGSIARGSNQKRRFHAGYRGQADWVVVLHSPDVPQLHGFCPSCGLSGFQAFLLSIVTTGSVENWSTHPYFVGI